MAYDSILSVLDGSFRYKDAPSTIYVATIKDHPDFLKIGFCQLSFRRMRRSDPFIENILWESCTTRFPDEIGDITREQAYVFEQYLLDSLTNYLEAIPQLKDAKWGGYTETLRITQPQRIDFVKWIEDSMYSLLSRGESELLRMLMALSTSALERDLLNDRWDRFDEECHTRAAKFGRVYEPSPRY